LKSKDKEGWFPKWVQNALNGNIWRKGDDPSALRPGPVKSKTETNRERVARQRAERKKRMADEKALRDLKEKS
jgi:hypothetical protein